VAGGNLPGREPDDAEAAAVKTVWAIVAGLGAMLILSFVMVFVTMAHPPRPVAHKSVPPQCTCGCMRKAAP
jgi:hypothetical protein